MTQRTYLLFFFENNSKNWLLSKIWFKELNFFLSMTQKNRTHFFLNTTQWIDPIFLNVTQLKFGLKKSQKIDFFLQNWTFLHMTRRIELLFVFEFGLKELNLLLFDSKNWAFFLLDAMHWTFFLFSAKNSLSHIGKQERFNSLSHIREKKVESSESYWRISILRVVFKKNNSILKKKIFKKKKSILWFVLKKYSSVIRIRTSKKNSILRVIVKKKGSILRVIFWKNILKRRFKSVSHRKSNSLSFFFGEKNQVFESCYKEGFNSSSHIGKNLWVILKKKKSSVLCIVFLVKAQFFESFFFFFLRKTQKSNSLTHARKNSILRVMLKKVQFIESCSNKSEFDSLSHTPKRGRFYSFSHAQKKKTILWVTF